MLVESDSRHGRLALKVLTRLEKLLLEKGLRTRHDDWPYHIGVEVNGIMYSLFCGGFDKRIDIQRLRKQLPGKHMWPDSRFKEVSFMTPEGAANYMQKLKYTTCTKVREESNDT